jgi:regulatory protein
MFKTAKPLKNPDDEEHGYNYALFVLNLSMRTEGELREKMAKRGYFPEVINNVIKRLYIDRYLDDKRYAEVFLDTMKRYKTYGEFIIRRKMLEKKLPKEIVTEAMVEFLTEEDQKEIAIRYVEKNFGTIKAVAKLSYDEKQKIMRRLLSRGFGIDLVKNVVGQ